MGTTECGLSWTRWRSEASPALLQRGAKCGPPGGAHVAVDAVHARHLVAHPLGLQDLGNTVPVHPGTATDRLGQCAHSYGSALGTAGAEGWELLLTSAP